MGHTTDDGGDNDNTEFDAKVDNRVLQKLQALDVDVSHFPAEQGQYASITLTSR